MTKPPPIPAFVISLAGSPRRRTVAKNLAKVGITAPILHDAVNGRNLTPEQLKPFDDVINTYLFSKVMLSGSKGCTLSHVSIWQKMVDEDIPSAVIFEDDVVPVIDDPELMAECLNYLVSIQDRLDVVFLNNVEHRPVIRVDGSSPSMHGVGVVAKRNTCTESYFITQHGAKYLLSHPKLYALEVDLFMHFWWHHRFNYNVLYNTPTLFRQANVPSEIGLNTPPNYHRKGLLMKICVFISKQYISLKKRLLFPLYVRHAKRKLEG